MKPLDPRLLRFARSTRGFIVVAVILGVITAILVIAQARLLSEVIVSVTSDGADWTDVRDMVVAVAAIFAGRAAVAWFAEVAAVRASARAKQELREAALEHVLQLGPAGPGVQSPGETSALITRGIDALDAISGGERQRIALARLLLAARPLVILDEPTEHLDGPTADALVQTMRGALESTTVVTITHRLLGVEDSHRIVELQEGRIVAAGTHDEVFALDGWYAQQWRLESERKDMAALLPSLPIGRAVPGSVG